MRWAQVDLAKKQILVAGTKTESSYRTVPIIQPLADLLGEIRGRRGEEPADATVLAIRECKGALRTGCSAPKIKKLVHHDLRHLFATRCSESGVDIPTVSRWLGHSDGGALAMKTYGHLRQEHSAAQAAKVISSPLQTGQPTTRSFQSLSSWASIQEVIIRRFQPTIPILASCGGDETPPKSKAQR